MRYVLGVDAGNTKTIALVADLDGQIMGMGRSGCGDIYGVYGTTAAVHAVRAAMMEALHMARVAPHDLAAGGFSMAGADWPEDYQFWYAELVQHGITCPVVVVNDALGALRAGSPDGTGVAVVCGTGCAIGARSPDGPVWHSSFWHDVGGGGDLGRRTLRAVYRAELGIEPPTSLRERVLTFFSLCSPEDVLHLFTARDKTPPNTATLAPLLLDEAAHGDAAAREIVREHGVLLGEYALAAARRVGIEHTSFPLVLAGGVLRHTYGLLIEALIKRVQATAPAAAPVNSRFEPAVGALFLAFDQLHISVEEALLWQLEPSLPAASFFAT